MHTNYDTTHDATSANTSGAVRWRVQASTLLAILLLAPASLAQTAGLVAAYSFDEGTGVVAIDRSGSGNTGSLLNGAGWSTTSKFGTAANFDGTNDRIDIADSNSLDLTTGMTMEAWVRPTRNSSYSTVILKEVPGELSYALYATDSDHGGRPSGWVRLNSSSRYADGPASLPLNVYSHIAVSYNGSQLTFYVNGTPATKTSVSGTIQSSALPLRIGGNLIWGEYFQGQIDEVRVYNRALTQAEILVDMTTPIGNGGGGVADTVAPTVTLTAPLNGASVSGSTALSANASDNIGVVGVQFKVDGANTGAEDTSSPFSTTWNAASVSAGPHQITAVARDAAGNTSMSPSITVQVASTPPAPVVSLVSPVNGSGVSGIVSLAATASDASGIAGVQFKLDGSNIGTEDTTSPYSFSWDSRTVGNGLHVLTAVARNTSGVTTTAASASVTVSNGDAIAPAVSITSQINGSTVSATTTLRASASDNIAVVGVRFRVDGVNVGAEDTSSPFRVSWNPASVSAGTHSLTAVARDAAGNTTTSAAVSITVNRGDSTAPTVSITSPMNGAMISGTATFVASASDNIAVVGVRFRVDGADVGVEDTSAPYTSSWNSALVTGGTHTVAAVARDAAGNSTTSPVVSITVNNGDTTAPTVSFTSPVNGATVSGTTTLRASASDNVGVVGVQFKLDGGNLGTEDLTSPYTFSWNTTTASNGSHQLSVIARDAAGRTGSGTANVVINNAAGASLTIDGNQKFQVMDGFGVSANSASWDNGELRPAIDLLTAGGTTIWRVVMEMADWEAVNDNSDPNSFNWTYYNQIYSNPQFEELWATLSYLNQKGISSKLMLNFMGIGPSWMGGPDLPASMEDEWVETVSSVAYYARFARGIQFALFAPNNESDWDGIEGIRMNAAQHVRVMRKLSIKLDAIGLGDLRFVGPDTADIGNGVNVFMPAMMADPVVMSKLDNFAFHNYSGSTGGAASAIQNSAYPGSRFWMTEVSVFGDAMNQLGQGPAAILVWDGFDSVYNHAIMAGRGIVPPNDAGNGPALLAYNTASRVYTPRKQYYEFAQLFKFVPPGSVRVAAAESNGNVTIYAFSDVSSGRVTLVGRNAGSSSVTFSATMVNLPSVPYFEFYRTDSSVNLQRGSDVPVANGAFTLVAPPNSVFTLTYPVVP